MANSEFISLELPASHKFLGIIGACISEIFMHYQVDSATLYQLQLAIHEACTNIVDHAYGPDISDGRIWITFTLPEEPLGLITTLRDSGAKTFELNSQPEPTLEQIRGRGLFLIQQIMDEVEYRPEPGNNHWRLVKWLDA